MTKLPSEKECIRILKDAGCDSDVVKHCKAVSDMAVLIAEKIEGANIKLVRVGGLLHDLGRAETHGIAHAIKGAKLAEKLNLPEDVIGIIRNHIGAGLTLEESFELGLPDGDYMPETLEQKIVAHADNMIDYFKPVPISNIITKLSARGQSRAVERITKLHEELSKLAGVNLDKLVEK
ncbi:MAG: HDIG domain-containing protein [Thermoplasmata archaeon]|nr:MAG: HDIG domain-containing protein [Thermoplasmata archaeon]